MHEWGTSKYSHVKWDVMKRKDVPKKVKQTPRAPLVLICDTMRVVTVAYSTSADRETSHQERVVPPGRAPQNSQFGNPESIGQRDAYLSRTR